MSQPLTSSAWLAKTQPQSQCRQDLHNAWLPSTRAATLRRHGLAKNGRAHNYSPTEQTLQEKLLVQVFLLWHIKRFATTCWNMSPLLNHSWVIRACKIFRGNCSHCFCCLPGHGCPLRPFCICRAWQQTQLLLAECRRVKVWSGPRRQRSKENFEVQLNCLLQRFNPVLVLQKIMRDLLTSTWEILTLACSVFLSVSLAEELLSMPCREVAQASLFRCSFEQDCGFPSPKMRGCLAF